VMVRVLLLPVLVIVCSYASAQKSEYKGFPSLTWPKLYTINFSTERDNLGEYKRPVLVRGESTPRKDRIVAGLWCLLKMP
jgi:hypothetical protein